MDHVAPVDYASLARLVMTTPKRVTSALYAEDFVRHFERFTAAIFVRAAERLSDPHGDPASSSILLAHEITGA